MIVLTSLAILIFTALATAARQPHDRRPGGMPAPGLGHLRSEGSPTLAGARDDQTRPNTVSRERFDAMRHLAYVRGKRVKQLKRVVLAKPIVAEAINLACTVYGNCATLWQLARCESNLNPNAQNASGSSGLLQFMPSTFRSTPFGGFSIWSPYANAMAGGWMLAHGRRSEWVC